MVYSNTTTKQGLLQRYERHSQLGDGVVTGDDTLKRQVNGDINETLYDLTSIIIRTNDNFDFDDPNKTDYPVATTPLIASQRDYQFDSISFLKIKRVDVTYDGTNWYRATPFDSGTYQEGLGNDTLVDKNFDKSAPYYDPKGFGLWLYPLPNADDVAAGGKIRVEYVRAYDEFAYDDTTAEPPIDRPFHDLIAIGAALKLPSLPDKQYQKLSTMYARGVDEMVAHYATRNEDFYMDINPQLETYT